MLLFKITTGFKDSVYVEALDDEQASDIAEQHGYTAVMGMYDVETIDSHMLPDGAEILKKLW